MRVIGNNNFGHRNITNCLSCLHQDDWKAILRVQRGLRARIWPAVLEDELMMRVLPFASRLRQPLAPEADFFYPGTRNNIESVTTLSAELEPTGPTLPISIAAINTISLMLPSTVGRSVDVKDDGVGFEAKDIQAGYIDASKY